MYIQYRTGVSLISVHYSVEETWHEKSSIKNILQRFCQIHVSCRAATIIHFNARSMCGLFSQLINESFTRYMSKLVTKYIFDLVRNPNSPEPTNLFKDSAHNKTGTIIPLCRCIFFQSIIRCSSSFM